MVVDVVGMVKQGEGGRGGEAVPLIKEKASLPAAHQETCDSYRTRPRGVVEDAQETRVASERGKRPELTASPSRSPFRPQRPPD